MKYRKFIAMALVVLGFACQREETGAPESGAGQPIALFTRSGAADAPVFAEGDRMGMYVTSAGEALKTTGNLYTNAWLALSEGAWTGTTMYYPNASNVDIYTYFPHSAVVADVNALNVTVAADQTVAGAYRKSDFLWAKTADQVKTKEGLEIALQHRMSKAEVQLLAGDGVSNDYLAKAKSVRLLGLKTTATADLATGGVAVADGASVVNVTAAPAGERLWMAIVAPQALAAGTEAIEIVLEDGNKRIYRLEKEITYQPGKVKHFDITVSNDALTVAVVSIEEWTSDGDILQGDAKIEVSAPQINGDGTVAGTLFAKDSRLGMYFMTKDGVMTDGGNVLYTAGDDGAVSSNTTLYYPLGKDVNVYAYAPYSENISNMEGYNFNVKVDQRLAADATASDLLVAKAEGLKNGGEAASLSFKHVMSQVVVNLKKGNGLNDSDLDNAKVGIMNVMQQAMVNLKTGACVSVSDKNDMIPAEEGTTFTAILIPQTLSGSETFLKITLGNQAYVYKSGMTLKPGSKYTLNVTVSNSGISVGVPVISGWNEEPPIDADAEKDPRGPIPSDDEAGIPPAGNNGVAIPDCSFGKSAANEKICAVNIPGMKVNGEYVQLAGTGMAGQTVWLTVNGKEKGCYVVPKDDADGEKLMLDIVFLVDNSSTMADEANNVAKGMKAWYDHLSSQPNLDVKVGSVGFAYMYDNYSPIQSVNIGTGVSGALDMTGGTEFDAYLNQRKRIDGNPATGTQRTQGFGGSNAADLFESAKTLNAAAAPSEGECVVIALKYADRYFNWRQGANRIYVVFTDIYNYATKEGYRVADIDKSFNGTVYTVWSESKPSYLGSVTEQNPWWLSINTGAVLEKDALKTGNGGVLYVNSTASDLDLINNFDVTGVALNTRTVQFYAAEESDGVANGKHRVKVTVCDKTGKLVGVREYSNVTF